MMIADPTTLAVTTANSNQKSHPPPAHPSCCRQPRGPAVLARARLAPYRGAVNRAGVHAVLALPAHSAAVHRSAALGTAQDAHRPAMYPTTLATSTRRRRPDAVSCSTTCRAAAWRAQRRAAAKAQASDPTGPAISKAVTDRRPMWPMSNRPLRLEVPCQGAGPRSPVVGGPFPGPGDAPRLSHPLRGRRRGVVVALWPVTAAKLPAWH